MAKPAAGKKYQISAESIEDGTRVGEALFTDFRDLELQSGNEFRINITLRERGLAYIDNRVPIVWTSDSESRPVSIVSSCDRGMELWLAVPNQSINLIGLFTIFMQTTPLDRPSAPPKRTAQNNFQDHLGDWMIRMMIPALVLRASGESPNLMESIASPRNHSETGSLERWAPDIFRKILVGWCHTILFAPRRSVWEVVCREKSGENEDGVGLRYPTIAEQEFDLNSRCGRGITEAFFDKYCGKCAGPVENVSAEIDDISVKFPTVQIDDAVHLESSLETIFRKPINCSEHTSGIFHLQEQVCIEGVLSSRCPQELGTRRRVNAA
ncbi:hypothetical protein B0H19DRAFT_1331282 [Mycena capillaripes]|nr:hypothetical protein B0H19DRAFT_1331282 [Mycena capillaripes]